MISLLAQYAFRRPFLDIPPIWDYWALLLLPLIVVIAVVYKSVKCHQMKDVPKEATILSGWILGAMVLAAGVLTLIVKFMER